MRKWFIIDETLASKQVTYLLDESDKAAVTHHSREKRRRFGDDQRSIFDGLVRRGKSSVEGVT